MCPAPFSYELNILASDIQIILLTPSSLSSEILLIVEGISQYLLQGIFVYFPPSGWIFLSSELRDHLAHTYFNIYYVIYHLDTCL